jgi:hypothetical protein
MLRITLGTSKGGQRRRPLTLIGVWDNEPDRCVAHLQAGTMFQDPSEVVFLHEVVLNWELWRRFSCGCISLEHRWFGQGSSVGRQ